MTISSTVGNQQNSRLINREYSNNTSTKKTASHSYLGGCSERFKQTLDKIGKVVLRSLKFLFTAALAIGFPGTFIAGLCTGLIIRVSVPSEKIKKSIDDISRIWKNQSWCVRSAAVLFAIYGMPLSLFMASFARAAQLGLQQSY